MPSFLIHGDKLLVDNAIQQCLADYDATDILESNIHHLAASRLDFGELLHICSSIPFIDNYRIVIIDGLCALMETKSSTKGPQNKSNKTNVPWATLSNHIPLMPSSTLLVFKEGMLNKNNRLLRLLTKVSETQHVPAPSGVDLSRWIKKTAEEKGAAISPGSIKYLSNLLGNDLESLDHELEKLSLYTDGETIQEAHVQEMVSQAQEANIFRAVDAIIQGQPQTSLNLIHNLKIHGRSTSYIIGMVTRQLRQLTLVHSLLEIGTNQTEIGALLGISSNYAVQKTVEQAIKYSSEDIKWKYEQLLQCDLNIKQGKLSTDRALESLVINLSSAS